ncbi:hypothetical protein MPTK1_5g19360 [Marchantia polymorpha subsp. ruderalis]|uniref:Uncharacterized protein n=2 Tax=Marchantia polymorpha TaxID=3197 RepID=A0AAF6BK15_MARPO|nr:hypothetical protein MARPO_0073s0008 [Marchantia polymorpha]BBN12349.1 hypothetical protein Mp_5g19360 [Marchantia polymorpha subsp. ruderalis]|eukprot:PTQ35128.1 hypothetical protein MARPO_0073s0008 [Marchantia polymorpha]
MTLVSDIKLIRTDTTLDLSQKAEKVKKVVIDRLVAEISFYIVVDNITSLTKWKNNLAKIC